MFRNTFCICDPCGEDVLLSIGNYDCTRNIVSSEICGIIMLPKTATKPTDWQTLAGWTGVIDNSNTTNTKGKYFSGIGSVPVPQKTFVQGNRGYKKIAEKLYSIQMDVISLDDSMYLFLKKLQCNPRNYTFWLHVTSGHILGVSQGINPNFTEVDFPYERGEDSYQKGLLNIEWRSKCEPERALLEDFESVIENNLAPDTWGSTPNEVWGGNPNEVWLGG